jgi:nucleotide-binding universal stress UspA family protein
VYKKVLIAVDGSDCSMRAAEAGLDVAKALGATTVILTVTPTWKSIGLSELATGVSEEQFAARTRDYGDQCLAKVAELASAKQVACTTIQVPHARPSEVIIEAAEEHGCDLIVMGSHGRRGAARLLLGSETSKVVAQGKTAVLVHRG